MSLLGELKRRNVLRVSAAYIVGAWAVAQVADLAFDSFDAPDWAMQAVLVLLLIGLPIAAAAAWILELGPEGLQIDHDGHSEPVYQRRTEKRLNALIAAFVLLGLGMFALTFTLQSGSSDKAEATSVAEVTDALQAAGSIEPSIAVLPFIDMSPAQDQRHLADGLPTELMTALHRVDRLRVVSRTSSFAFRDSGKSIAEIAEALDVDHVVEGSIQRSGQEVRIEAALVDVRTDERLWSESYTQPMGDAFALQAGITRKIASALKVVIGDETESNIDQVFEATANPEAYEEFLLGTTLWARRGETNIRAAIGHLERAIELEPNFARAEAALANAYITLPSYTYVTSSEQWDELTNATSAKAVIHAQNAMALDPDLVAPYAALGDMARLDSRWMDAERFYQKGLNIDPDDVTLVLWYSEHLADIGKIDEAMAVSRRAVELDPLSPGAHVGLAGGYMIKGDCESMRSPARIALSLGHDFGQYVRVLCSLYDEDWAKTLDILENFEIRDDWPSPEELIDKLQPFVNAADPEAKATARRDLIAYLETWTYDPSVTFFLSALDEIDRMVEMFEQETVANPTWASAARSFWGAAGRKLRQHPSFPGLLEKSGLLAFYRESGIVPDDCEWVGDDLDCTVGL